MNNCEQTAGQSVYQHGISVHNYFTRIVSGDIEGMRLPDWFKEYDILANLHNADVIRDYTVYHDCGKPFCRTVVDDKVHFPNHAEVSKKVYLEATGDVVVSNLIGWDMDFHTAKAEEIQQKCSVWTIQDAMTLLVAAFSELHSNANLFGGISSTSFKIKYKQLDKRGKQVCKLFFT